MPRLLRFASRFNESEPLVVGHVLNGVWPSVGFAGGAGMLLSRGALRRMGSMLSRRAMPLPPAGTPNDVHMARWARRLGIQPVHTNLFWYSSLPADARLVSVVGLAAGREVGEYVGGMTARGVAARANFTRDALRA